MVIKTERNRSIDELVLEIIKDNEGGITENDIWSIMTDRIKNGLLELKINVGEVRSSLTDLTIGGRIKSESIKEEDNGVEKYYIIFTLVNDKESFIHGQR